MQTYSELHPTPVCATISLLARRIGERFPDSVDLSRKIWQKITILDMAEPQAAEPLS